MKNTTKIILQTRIIATNTDVYTTVDQTSTKSKINQYLYWN